MNTTREQVIEQAADQSLPDRDPRSDTLSAVLIIVYASLFLLGSAVFWSYSESLFLWAFFFRHFNVYYTPFVTVLRTVSIALALVGGVGLVYAAASLYLRSRKQNGLFER